MVAENLTLTSTRSGKALLKSKLNISPETMNLLYYTL
jgi:hypothetical protein